MELTARLRAFAALARHDSFSRAAIELGISQPAVSKHVADLERELQVQLVVRHPRGARLTPAGTFLAGYVERAEALLAQEVDVILLDVAHADADAVEKAVKEIRSRWKELPSTRRRREPQRFSPRIWDRW